MIGQLKCFSHKDEQVQYMCIAKYFLYVNELNNYNVEGNKDELINKLGKITIKVKKKIKPTQSLEKKKINKK